MPILNQKSDQFTDEFDHRVKRSRQPIYVKGNTQHKPNRNKNSIFTPTY